MTDIDTNLTLEPPDPAYVSIVAAFLRGAIQIVAGMGFLAGAYTDSQIMMAATALVALVTLGWSAYQKLQAAKRRHDAAVQSALRSAAATQAAGTPVAIAVVAPPKMTTP